LLKRNTRPDQQPAVNPEPSGRGPTRADLFISFMAHKTVTEHAAAQVRTGHIASNILAAPGDRCCWLPAVRKPV